jgi:putative transposase
MPFTKMWVHLVWATKNREAVLVPPFRQSLFEHIKENAKTKEIFLDRVNGYYDHLHCLVSLGSSDTIEKTVQLIKGESSYWFNNKSGFKAKRLIWQDGYFAVSVSPSAVDVVRAYIDNQEIHHQKKSFAQEYDQFISRFKF